MAEREVKAVVYRGLRVTLSPEEQLLKGEKLAAEVAALVAIKEINKEKRAAMKIAEDEQQSRMLAVQFDVSDRSEERSVACDEVFDYVRGVVEIVRQDTSAVVESRSMTAGERQLSIPGAPPPPPLEFDKGKRKGKGKGKLTGISGLAEAPPPPEPPPTG